MDTRELEYEYQQAKELYEAGKYYEAYILFKELGQFKDSFMLAKECEPVLEGIYDEAKRLFDLKKYEEAKELFIMIQGYSDSESMIERCDYKIRELADAREAERRIEEERRIAREEAERRERLEAEAREREDREREEREARRRREAAEASRRASRERVARVESVIQYIILSVPLIFIIVFAIILFSNKNQITILYGSGTFSTWTTFWVFYLIGSSISSLILLVKHRSWSGDDKPARTSAIVILLLTLIVSFVVFPNAGKLETHFNPPTDLVLSVTYKANTTDNGYYVTTFSFSTYNKGRCNIVYFKGPMAFYKGSTHVATYNVYSQGRFYPKGIVSTDLTLERLDRALYDISFSELGITYCITEVQFEGMYDTQKYSGKTIQIKYPE